VLARLAEQLAEKGKPNLNEETQQWRGLQLIMLLRYFLL
jgi:hypothetical protein